MTTFLPMNESVLSQGLTLFSKVSSILAGLVSVVFFMRIAYLVVKISPGSDYGDVIKDTVAYFAASSIYPVLLRMIVFSVNEIAAKVSYISNVESQLQIQEFFDKIFSTSIALGLYSKLGDTLVLGIANAIYTAFISILIAAAPIFIFLSTMLDLQGGLKVYFGLILSLCLWPIMWNLLGQLSLHVGGAFHESPITSVCFYVVIHVLQLLSPIFSFSLFKSMSLNLGVGKVASLGRML